MEMLDIEEQKILWHLELKALVEPSPKNLWRLAASQWLCRQVTGQWPKKPPESH